MIWWYSCDKLLCRVLQISQIVRVMNEHTNSLQWIDENSEAMKQRLESLSKLNKDCRKDHERTVQYMFKQGK